MKCSFLFLLGFSILTGCTSVCPPCVPEVKYVRVEVPVWTPPQRPEIDEACLYGGYSFTWDSVDVGRYGGMRARTLELLPEESEYGSFYRRVAEETVSKLDTYKSCIKQFMNIYNSIWPEEKDVH